MDKIHIEKGGVQETLIIPLYGRKLCAECFYLQLTGKTVFPKAMAFTNVLILFAVLKGVPSCCRSARFVWASPTNR